MSVNIEPILDVINNLPSIIKKTDSSSINQTFSSQKQQKQSEIYQLLNDYNTPKSEEKLFYDENKPDNHFNETSTPTMPNNLMQESNTHSSCSISSESSENSRDNNNNQLDNFSNNNNMNLDLDDLNNFSSSVYDDKSKNDQMKKQTRIPMGLFSKKTQNNAPANDTKSATKIPRISATKLPKPVTPITLNLSSNSASSLTTNNQSFFSTPTSTSLGSAGSHNSDHSSEKNLIETTNLEKPSENVPRVSRSISRWVGVNSTNAMNYSCQENENTCNNVKTTNNMVVNNKTLSAVNAAKRGVSMTATSSTKSTRSDSITDDICDHLSENRFNQEPQKTVRYIIKHKPKESQVIENCINFLLIE